MGVICFVTQGTNRTCVNARLVSDVSARKSRTAYKFTSCLHRTRQMTKLGNLNDLNLFIWKHIHFQGWPNTSVMEKSTLSWWHRENYICTTILTLNPTLILMGTRVMIIFMPIPSGDNMGAKYTFWFLNARSFLHKINKKRTSYNTVCMHSCNIFQYFYVTGYTDKLKPQKQIRDSCTRVCHPKCLFFIADRCQNSRITF